MHRLLFLFLLLPLLAHAAPPAEQWFTVLLDGRKIGHFEHHRVSTDDRVTTIQRLVVELDRAGTSIGIASSETSEETVDGKPLAFSSRSRLSGSESVIEGRIENDRLHLRLQQAGEWQEREVPWPEGALLLEGQRLAAVRTGLTDGTRLTQLTFQPSSADSVSVTSTVGALETIDLPGGAQRLHKIEQSMDVPGTPVRSTVWVDQDFNVRKLVMPMLGMDLTLLSCDRACANAANQPADIFSRTLMAAPRALTTIELDQSVRYIVRARHAQAAAQMPTTGEQSIRNLDGRIVVDVRAQAQPIADDNPHAADYAANDWLQSAAPEIITLAKRGVGDGRDDAARMHNLETFVRNFIVDKNLGTGYASALEVARNPKGDCTEHAVLLAALGRAQGIATRVVTGLAYTDQFAGQSQVFVPHAWVQAWIGDRWQSYDAAMAGFDAGHIALSIGDGDPWRFYQGLDLLGTLKLERAEAGTRLSSP